MKVRIATEADALGIWDTHVSAIRVLCAGDYSPVQIEAWAGPRKPEDYLRPITERRMFVAEIDGRVVGFGEFEGSEIAAVYVYPAFARSGIGSALFRHLLEAFRQRGVWRASLASSLTSVPFYLAMGCVRGEVGSHRLGSGIEIPCVRMSIAVPEQPNTARACVKTSG